MLELYNGWQIDMAIERPYRRVLANYDIHKKLSQFNYFQYLSKFHASQWRFGK
jgi:hypothetical protein